MSEIVSGRANIRKDPEMERLIADWFRAEGMNPERLTIQAGWFNRQFYVVRIRFRDLYRMSQNGAQKILFFVEHCFDSAKFAAKYGGNGRVPNQALIAWVLGVCAQTLPMAHAEWVQVRHMPWPEGFPRVDPYKTRRGDIGVAPETLERLTGELTRRATT